MKQFKTLAQFISHFNSEEVCREFFEEVRFKNGLACPHCGHKEIMRFADGKRFRCHKCRRDFTVKTGTPFGESKIPLQQWFIAMYLLTTRKKGISSIELAEQIGCTQKTAWFIDHRLREAFKQDVGKLFGTVEVDETYVGGKERNKHWDKRVKLTQGRSTKTKTPVMGLFQRGGKIKTTVVPDVKVATIEKRILANIRKGSKVYTDDFLSYIKLSKHYKHGVVSHGRGEYVRGNIHSNSAESFWALFKRGYMGTYHKMSRKHLQRYADEFAFRYNTRGVSMDVRFADALARVAQCGKLSYKTLTA